MSAVIIRFAVVLVVVIQCLGCDPRYEPLPPSNSQIREILASPGITHEQIREQLEAIRKLRSRGAAWGEFYDLQLVIDRGCSEDVAAGHWVISVWDGEISAVTDWRTGEEVEPWRREAIIRYDVPGLLDLVQHAVEDEAEHLVVVWSHLDLAFPTLIQIDEREDAYHDYTQVFAEVTFPSPASIERAPK